MSMLNKLIIGALVVGSLIWASTAIMKPESDTPAVEEFTLTGIIEGVPDQTISLTRREKGLSGPATFLTTKLVNGQFEFEGRLENPPVRFFVEFEDDQYRLRQRIIAENSAMSLTGTVDEQNVVHAEVAGSVVHTQYQAFRNELDQGFPVDAMTEEIFDLWGTPWDNPLETMDADLRARIEQMIEQQQRVKADRSAFLKQFIEQNPDSIVSILALSVFESGGVFGWTEEEELQNSAQAKLLHAGLSDSVRTTAIGREYEWMKEMDSQSQRAKEGTMVVGQEFVDFSQPDADGNVVQISSLLEPGRYLYVDFWASWCAPCRAENPNLIRAYEKFNDAGFDVVAVSVDSDRDDWLDAVEEDGTPWLHLSELNGLDAPVADIYGLQGVPVTLLLDGAGTIVATNLNGEDLHNRLAELLN